jgi:adenylyltransferase/sulfurtransferase
MMPRHYLIKGWRGEDIESAKVLVAGCGAIGSSTALKLARIGSSRFYLVDHDRLEEHNIYNQEYSKGELGKPKVLALKERIKEINPRARVEVYIGRIQECPESFFSADLYFSCLDNFASRFFLNYISITNDRPLIDAGIEGFSGTVRTTIPGETFCMECYPSLIPEPSLASCSRNPIPSTVLTASHASDIQVMQMLKILFGWKFYPYIYFDLRRGVFESIDLKRNPRCGLCGYEGN